MPLPRFLRHLYEPVVVDATIAASPAAVYDVLADPTTYPDWLVGAQAIRRVDDRFPAPGAEFEHTVGAAAPLQVDDATESVQVEPGRHLGLVVHAGLFHARVDFELTPDEPGTTEVRFSEQAIGPLAVLAPLLRPTLAVRNKESLRRLADRLADPALLRVRSG